jgi:hypothetical protein
MQFGGRYWQAVHPQAEPRRLPAADGVTTYDGYTSGSISLVNPGLLRFLVEDPLSQADGQTFDFVPLPGAAPVPCE